MSLKKVISGVVYNAQTRQNEEVIFPSAAEYVETDNGSTVQRELNALPGKLLSAHDTVLADIRGGVSASGDTLAKLYVLITALQELTRSSDVNLDTVSEIVSYIKEHEEDLTLMGVNKVNVSDIVNSLDTASTVEGKALDARQGKALSDLISILKVDISGLKTQAGSLATKDELNAGLEAAVNSGRVIISDTAPLNPVDGQLWFKQNGYAEIPD